MEGMERIKGRLFILFATGELQRAHGGLCEKMKKEMKYKWMMYNTVLYLVLMQEGLYVKCADYLYLCEYYNSAMAPEAQVESSFSTLKALLKVNSSLSLKDINDRFRINCSFKTLYSDEAKENLTQCATAMENQLRSPYIDLNRSQYTQSEVVDWIRTFIDEQHYVQQVDSDEDILEDPMFDDLLRARVM